MPRYYFSKSYNGKRAIDDVGEECASEADARRKAVKALSVAALDASPGPTGKAAYSIHVTDETDRVLFIATLSLLLLDQDPSNQ